MNKLYRYATLYLEADRVEAARQALLRLKGELPLRIRILQAKDEDGYWYDDAYACEDTTGKLIFRYNLTWENIGSYYNGRVQETGILLDEIDTVINPGDEMRWLPIEEVEDSQVEAYLETLDERCGIPKPRPVVQVLPT